VADTAQEKTEPPTVRRRREAREQGNVARSNDLGAAVVLLGGLIGLYFTARPIAIRLVEIMRLCLGSTDESVTQPQALGELTVLAVQTMGPMLFPMFIALMVASLIVSFAQVGWLLTLEPLKPSLNKLNPISGLKRFVSMQQAVTLGLSVLKMAAAILVAYFTIRQQYPLLVTAAAMPTAGIVVLLAKMLFTLAVRLSALLLLLAILDYAYQKYRYEQDLKMTKQEVKEEHRSMEGDPQLKARRRRVQLDIAMQRMRNEVPKADVVVTNPTEIAVALRYDEATMAAPRVVAKGKGFMAEQIRKMAIEHGVPLVEKKPLAQALYKTVEIGQEVPPQFYRAVAEILAYVYELTGRHRRPAAAAG
jgi:flagellar biosynthetic protein FlhB